ncbi:Homeobox protein knotted-1-like 1 [Melia azedarach]|uniref:Homeobox protein knotted-1-like 1 n=1 Tax=Melia azedarach TaxID=155640 RepID=A0ACC1XGU0_MELAZ|nr:Homeobox protein knotted-1-like 1 [Melia azedarach]
MEAANNGSQENANGKNGDKYCNNVRFGSDIVVGDRQEEEDDGEEILKRRISSHPLYGQLIETHLNCLKVGLGEIGEVAENLNQPDLNLLPKIPTSSELDRFMEAYCFTLKKLKEALEEPLKETSSFIEEMYIQLKELCENDSKPNSPPT